MLQSYIASDVGTCVTCQSPSGEKIVHLLSQLLLPLFSDVIHGCRVAQKNFSNFLVYNKKKKKIMRVCYAEYACWVIKAN